jgi:hypothetical protein
MTIAFTQPVRFAVVVAVFSAFLIVLAPPTSAAPVNASAGMYHCVTPAQTRNDGNFDPNGQCTSSFATIASGTPVTMVCWQDGRTPAGYTSPRWFYVLGKDITGVTREGFIYSARINVADQATVGHCSMRRELATTMWATSHLGQVITQDASERNSYTDWAPGPVGEWSGDCVKLVHLAWWKRTHTGNAAQIYSKYASVMNSMSTTPPRGAMIFWDGATASGFGHVALSLGNGYMVTTQGLDGDAKPIAIQKISAVAGADGWVSPANAVVTGHNPVGAYDSVVALGGGRVRVRGWSWDASNSGVQLTTHVYVGGTAGQSGASGYNVGSANAYRSDVDRVYHSGAYHGIDKTFTTSKRGSQKVCVYAINTGSGANVLLGCKTITIT